MTVTSDDVRDIGRLFAGLHVDAEQIRVALQDLTDRETTTHLTGVLTGDLLADVTLVEQIAGRHDQPGPHDAAILRVCDGLRAAMLALIAAEHDLAGRPEQQVTG